MKIDNSLSDDLALKELGERISRHRLNKNMTQETLAKEAGISLPTLQRIEQGNSSTLTNFIRILRALKLLENFSMAIPQPPTSPIMQLASHKNIRHRASPKSSQGEMKVGDLLWEWAEKE